MGVLLDASGTFLYSSPTKTHRVDVFADAFKLLNAFRSRRIGKRPIRTAVVTNWGNAVSHMIAELGLDNCFDTIVTADDSRFTKPAPEIFALAASRLELPIENCIHIGDSLFDDALGAQNAGLQSIWVRRRANDFMTHFDQAACEKLMHPPVHTLEEALACLVLLLNA